jgi:alpha-ribazole phosphatase
MKILLIRHTESAGNLKRVYAGATDYELTEKGIKQVYDCINQFKKMYSRQVSKFKLYTSPLKRCTLLSDELENTLKVVKHIDHRLSETNFGIFEGKTYEDLLNEYPDLVKQWNENLIHFQIPNGESLVKCAERVNRFCDEVIVKNEDIVIVSHGGIIKLILLKLLSLDLDHFWKFYTNNGCIIELEYNNGFGFIKNLIQLNKGDGKI